MIAADTPSQSVQNNNQTVGIAIGFVLAAASLFVDWLTMPRARISFGGRAAGFELPMTLTGFNGSVGPGNLRIPIWFIVTLGLGALALRLLNLRGVTSLPRWLVTLPTLFSFLGGSYLLLLGITQRDLVVHVGPFLLLLGLMIGVAVSRSEGVRRPMRS